MTKFQVSSVYEGRDCDGRHTSRRETVIMDQVEFNEYIASQVIYYDTVVKEKSQYENSPMVYLTFHSVTEEGYSRLHVDYSELGES